MSQNPKNRIEIFWKPKICVFQWWKLVCTWNNLNPEKVCENQDWHPENLNHDFRNLPTRESLIHNATFPNRSGQKVQVLFFCMNMCSFTTVAGNYGCVNKMCRESQEVVYLPTSSFCRIIAKSVNERANCCLSKFSTLSVEVVWQIHLNTKTSNKRLKLNVRTIPTHLGGSIILCIKAGTTKLCELHESSSNLSFNSWWNCF